MTFKTAKNSRVSTARLIHSTSACSFSLKYNLMSTPRRSVTQITFAQHSLQGRVTAHRNVWWHTCVGVGDTRMRPKENDYLINTILKHYLLPHQTPPPPPNWTRASLLSRLHDHTQTRTTLDRTPLDGWSARRGDLYLHKTQHSQQTDMIPVGFEPATPAGERSQTHASDRAVIRIGYRYIAYIEAKCIVDKFTYKFSRFFYNIK